jgi:hypothetical protein
MEKKRPETERPEAERPEASTERPEAERPEASTERPEASPSSSVRAERIVKCLLLPEPPVWPSFKNRHGYDSFQLKCWKADWGTPGRFDRLMQDMNFELASWKLRLEVDYHGITLQCESLRGIPFDVRHEIFAFPTPEAAAEVEKAMRNGECDPAFMIACDTYRLVHGQRMRLCQRCWEDSGLQGLVCCIVSIRPVWHTMRTLPGELGASRGEAPVPQRGEAPSVPVLLPWGTEAVSKDCLLWTSEMLRAKFADTRFKQTGDVDLRAFGREACEVLVNYLREEMAPLDLDPKMLLEMLPPI